jgi:hypothetical protein
MNYREPDKDSIIEELRKENARLKEVMWNFSEQTPLTTITTYWKKDKDGLHVLVIRFFNGAIIEVHLNTTDFKRLDFGVRTTLKVWLHG